VVRVVFLTHNYPRWPGDFSGAALGSLARALVRRGISVQVVAPSEQGTGRAELDGVSVERVPIPSRLSHTIAEQDGFAAGLSNPLRWGTLFRLWRSLKAAAGREVAAGADLVHAHWWIPSGLAAPSGVPLVLTVHGADAALLRGSRIARSLARPLLRRAAIVTAVSRPAGEAVQNLTGRFLGPQHIHPMPIDSRGHPWTRGGGGAVLLGRLDVSGRVSLAVETVAVLASCGHDIPLTIIGDGPDRIALQQRAQRLGVSALVRFLGAMPADQARGHLARADLMLFTARGEGTAVAPLEALIMGVPVVACWDSGASVDVVPEAGGGRLSLPSAEALADNVLSLRADKDRLTVGRLVGEAWRTRLAPDHVAQLYEGWYRDALSR
jgi:glycosyltransferase involved in cell wall biosynthesis